MRLVQSLVLIGVMCLVTGGIILAQEEPPPSIVNKTCGISQEQCPAIDCAASNQIFNGVQAQRYRQGPSTVAGKCDIDAPKATCPQYSKNGVKTYYTSTDCASGQIAEIPISMVLCD
jgi:hypothetical protein